MRVALLASMLIACSGASTPAPPNKSTACDERSVLTAAGCVAIGMTEPAPTALACERGTFAAPGEAACHAPSAEAPADATVFVALDAPSGGDGSMARPFRTIQAAVTAAPADARIAIGAGVYRENVRVTRAVTLIGRGAVELAGVTADRAALELRAPTTVIGLAITGNGLGIAVTDTTATLKGVWVHDTAIVGVNVDTSTGTASVRVEGSLIESAGYAGVAAFGAEATIVSSAIRDTRFYTGKGGPGALGAFARGKRPKLVVQGSVVERNRETGVGVSGGDLVVEGSVVRDTEAMQNGTVGTGVLASFDKATGTTATLAIARSAVTGNREMGIALTGGTGTIEQTLVDDTRPRAIDDRYGVGIQADPKSVLTIRGSLVTRSRHMGIAYFGAEGAIEDTIVRDTLLEGANKTAVGVAIAEADGLRSNVTVTRSLADRNRLAGFIVGAADARLVDCSVRNSLSTADGLFGDGVVGLALDEAKQPNLTIEGLTAENNARAGVTMFGGSLVLTRSRLICNRVDLNTEPIPVAPTVQDGGANACGCSDNHECRAASNALAVPPHPLRGGR